MDERTVPSNETVVEDLAKNFEESIQCSDDKNANKDLDAKEMVAPNLNNCDNNKTKSNDNIIENGFNFEDTKLSHGSESEEEEEEEIEVDDEYLQEQEKKLSENEKLEAKEAALELKKEGNIAFKNERYKEAISEYVKALNVCPLSFSKERSILYANRAACRSKLGNKEIAVVDCTKAIELNPNYLKAFLRRAQLYRDLEKLDEALNDYQRVLDMDPNVLEARQACMTLPEEIKERNEKLKTEMIGKLKDLGNLFLRPFGLSTDNFNLVQDPNTGGYSVNFQNKQEG